MSLFTIRSGVENHPEATFLQLFSDLVIRGGVVDLIGGDYQVVESSGGLSVDVSSGTSSAHAYIKGASTYPVRLTAIENVEIDANSSGNPRITTIVAAVDLAVTPAEDGGGDDVHVLLAVNGTPASSPNPPSSGTIDAAVGGGGPWIALANVLVPNAASGIPQSNITDIRQRVFMGSKRPMVPTVFTSPFTPNFAVGDVLMSLTNNLTINAPTNMQINDWWTITLVQDATPRTVSFGSGIISMNPDMTMPTPSGKKATFAIKRQGASEYHAFLVGKEYT